MLFTTVKFPLFPNDVVISISMIAKVTTILALNMPIPYDHIIIGVIKLAEAYRAKSM